MIDRTHPLPITRQADALDIARSTVYALPRAVPERDLELMKRIDRLHLEMPFAGARMLRDLLGLEDIKVGRKHVATLMKRMGIEALYHKPRTTRKHPQHPVYWRDNVFVERLWRSVKYEEVYLHAYDTVSDSRTGIGRYFDLYNQRRPHSRLGRRTPDQVYFSQQPLTLAA